MPSCNKQYTAEAEERVGESRRRHREHGKTKTTLSKLDALIGMFLIAATPQSRTESGWFQGRGAAHKRQPGPLGKKSTNSIQEAYAHARPPQAAVDPTSTAGIGVRCPRSTTAPSTRSTSLTKNSSPKIDYQFLEVTSPSFAWTMNKTIHLWKKGKTALLREPWRRGDVGSRCVCGCGLWEVVCAGVRRWFLIVRCLHHVVCRSEPVRYVACPMSIDDFLMVPITGSIGLFACVHAFSHMRLTGHCTATCACALQRSASLVRSAERATGGFCCPSPTVAVCL